MRDEREGWGLSITFSAAAYRGRIPKHVKLVMQTLRSFSAFGADGGQKPTDLPPALVERG